MGVVKTIFPRIRWQEWRFNSVPESFWEEAQNRRRYLNWLGSQLGFRRREDWYRLHNRDLIRTGGNGLAKRFGFSLPAILYDYRPRYTWQEWRFTRVPHGFWAQQENRHRYLDWLGQQLGYREPGDWHTLRVQDVCRHHGGGLLQSYRGGLTRLVREYLSGGAASG